MAASYEFEFNILLLGHTGSGKSSIILCLQNKPFIEDHIKTIGQIPIILTETFEDRSYQVTVLDTAGTSYYSDLNLSSLKKFDAVFFIYDITERESFNYISSLLNDNSLFDGEVITVLLGNKSDQTDLRKISFEEGRQLADRKNSIYAEISVKNSAGVKELENAFFLEMETLDKTITELNNDLQQARDSASSSNLTTLHFDTMENSVLQVTTILNLIKVTVKQLVLAVSQPEEIHASPVIASIINEIMVFCRSVRSMTGILNDNKLQISIIDLSKGFLGNLRYFIGELRRSLKVPKNSSNQLNITKAADLLNNDIDKLLKSLPTKDEQHNVLPQASQVTNEKEESKKDGPSISRKNFPDNSGDEDEPKPKRTRNKRSGRCGLNEEEKKPSSDQDDDQDDVDDLFSKFIYIETGHFNFTFNPKK